MNALLNNQSIWTTYHYAARVRFGFKDRQVNADPCILPHRKGVVRACSVANDHEDRDLRRRDVAVGPTFYEQALLLELRLSYVLSDGVVLHDTCLNQLLAPLVVNRHAVEDNRIAVPVGHDDPVLKRFAGPGVKWVRHGHRGRGVSNDELSLTARFPELAKQDEDRHSSSNRRSPTRECSYPFAQAVLLSCHAPRRFFQCKISCGQEGESTQRSCQHRDNDFPSAHTPHRGENSTYGNALARAA